MDVSLQNVSTQVNTARSDLSATQRIMDVHKAQARRLKESRRSADYRSAREAALSNEWRESSYRAHENGTRTIGLDDAERYARCFRARGVNVTGRFILFGDEFADLEAPKTSSLLQVVARVGAGAEISTDFEQLKPDEGLFEIDVGFPVAVSSLAFEVEGDSMWPRYDPGDIVICGREGTDVDQVIGWEAAVRTSDGKRYLKRIRRGSSSGLFDLESHNASPIRDVKLEWAAEIDHVVRAGKWRRLDRAAQAKIVARSAKR